MEFSIKDAAVIENMIQVSKEKPLLPETFIPWDYEDKGDETYLPDDLISLSGIAEYQLLDEKQKIDLGKKELAQVMLAYGWSETMACAFFNRRLLKLETHDLEYQFLIRELIEEYRHQGMFCDTIKRIDEHPYTASRIHKWVASMTIKFAPDSIMFLSVLAIEQATDVYGDILRKDKNIHPVIRKVSLLHHIEEARHILYGKLWLKRYTENAGLIRRTIYGAVVIMNLYFMRTMYVRKEIFVEMGLKNPADFYKKAKKNLAIKFGKLCLSETKEYLCSFNGWNSFTRLLAKKLLKINL